MKTAKVVAAARCVWCPDETDEDGAEDVLSDGDTPEDAAIAAAQQRWHYCDYPNVQTVNVRDIDGNLSSFEVEAVFDVSFRVMSKA